MCRIDFSQPIEEDGEEMQEAEATGVKAIGNGKAHVGSNGNGAMVNGNGVMVKVSSSARSKSKGLVEGGRGGSGESRSLVVVKMKDPVLFLGHTGPNSLLIVEKPWLEVLRQFPAPVARHVYGS